MTYFGPALFVALLAAQPAAARCVTAADLDSGIAFQREDGRTGLAVRDGKFVRIDYATGADAWLDQRVMAHGLYEVQADFHFNALPTVGGGSPHFTWTYAGRIPLPKPGKTWTTSVSERRHEDIGTERTPPDQQRQDEVTFSFLDAMQVTLSGCPYTVVPVETAAGQRWLYFSDLGFAIETRRAEEGQRGLLSFTPIRAD